MWFLIQDLKKKYNYNIIDNLANEYGHEVKRLPPYHCQLNAIEFVWSDIKRQVSLKNTGGNIEEIKEIAQKVIDEFSIEKWGNIVNHVEK